MSDGDTDRRTWIRRNEIAGHWMDISVRIAPGGVREERAVCQCGWNGPVRTEHERSLADGDEHLLPLMPCATQPSSRDGCANPPAMP